MLLTHLTPDGVRRSRHQSLTLYGLVDDVVSEGTAAALSEIVRVARAFTGVDGVAVNLLPEGRQVTVAATDSDTPFEVPEAQSVCAALLEQRPVSTIVVPDLSRDPRFASLPHVNGEVAAVRGYASAPLLGNERVAIGTLCLWSLTPRTLTRDQTSLVDQLARAAVAVLDEARRDRRRDRRQFAARLVHTSTVPAA